MTPRRAAPGNLTSDILHSQKKGKGGRPGLLVLAFRPNCYARTQSYNKDAMRFIHLLSCGGTIEKAYFEQSGSVENVEYKIDKYLERLRLPGARVCVTRLMNKDSLDMTGADRQYVLDAARRLLAERNAPLVISHGTDTMVETGLWLRRNLAELSVPAILTGAMTPLGFENSDALQNLTESLFAAHLLPPGVWVVMHNEVFAIDSSSCRGRTAAYCCSRASCRLTA